MNRPNASGRSVHHNLNIIGPDTPNDAIQALSLANGTAVTKSNQAQLARQRGDAHAAITLHREALALKLRTYPATSIQVAISLNGLGEALMAAGQLEEADEVLAQALAVRETAGPRLDAAATRENIGALREKQGRFAEAAEVRLLGRDGEMLCVYEKCPHPNTFSRNQLMACAACKTAFYCSKACQVNDWKARHRPLCKAFTAERDVAAAATTTDAADTVQGTADS
ncbi:hypothetical protein F5Y16DRAFT_423865 [Xylariaceae sp. FL0255]|nr:hypothetical protein F5Y16DRAFT_423865 [Xylariaceae sp. FL0255]